jgi:hypothetical protein
MTQAPAMAPGCKRAMTPARPDALRTLPGAAPSRLR